MKKQLAFFILIGFFSSCASVRNSHSSENINALRQSNLRKINGIYSNKAINGEAQFTSLWSTLNIQADSIPNWKNLKVKITGNEPKLITAELIENDKIIATENFVGKINQDYFLMNNQTKAKAGMVVLWFLSNSSVKIGLTDKDELLLLRRSDGMSMFIAFPVFAASSPLIETKYERLE